MIAIEMLLERLRKVRKSRGGWTACCPAHDDRTPSLSIGEGRNGGILLHCWSGCEVGDIAAAAGLTMRDLMPPDGEAYQTARPPTARDIFMDQVGQAIILMRTAHASPAAYAREVPRGGFKPGVLRAAATILRSRWP